MSGYLAMMYQAWIRPGILRMVRRVIHGARSGEATYKTQAEKEDVD